MVADNNRLRSNIVDPSFALFWMPLGSLSSIYVSETLALTLMGIGDSPAPLRDRVVSLPVAPSA